MCHVCWGDDAALAIPVATSSVVVVILVLPVAVALNCEGSQTLQVSKLQSSWAGSRLR